MFTFLYDKFTQNNMYQILSQSVWFCRMYIKKHFGVFFGFTVYLFKMEKSGHVICHFDFWLASKQATRYLSSGVGLWGSHCTGGVRVGNGNGYNHMFAVNALSSQNWLVLFENNCMITHLGVQQLRYFVISF